MLDCELRNPRERPGDLLDFAEIAKPTERGKNQRVGNASEYLLRNASYLEDFSTSGLTVRTGKVGSHKSREKLSFAS